MRHHLVVVREPYLQLILSGHKAVECRLSSVRKSPFGLIAPGDLLWLKLPSQPIRAVASVRRCLFRELKHPADLPRLSAEYASLIRAEPGFFEDAASWARYATLIWMGTVMAIRPLPIEKSDQRAWVTLNGPPYPGMRISPSSTRFDGRREPRHST